MNLPPSGEQWEIRYGSGADSACATVVEVGGGLREYEVGGIAILDPFPLDAVCDGAHNMPLVPWPNRIRDGRYSFAGRDYQLDLSEPAQHNAIHGFGRWRNWTLRKREGNRIVAGLLLHPQPGYPFTLDVAVEYALDKAGLTVRTTASNLGDESCPYGCGQHPYLSCGTERIDELTLELDAAKWLPTDAQQIPTGTEAVADSPYDFRGGRTIGEQKIDYAFTDLARDADGKAWARVTSPGWQTRRPMGGRTLSLPRNLHRRHACSRAPATRTRRRTDELRTERFRERRRSDSPGARRVGHHRLGHRRRLNGRR